MADEAGEDALADQSQFLVDPLKFSIALFCILVAFVMYLLLPRGIRKQYFGAYPKRHAWSARRRRGYGQQVRTTHASETIVHSILFFTTHRALLLVDHIQRGLP